jgi:hypothetical protein
MVDRPLVQALIRDVVSARTGFEAGLVPADLEALLDRLGGCGFDGLGDMPGMVRGLVEEGPLPNSFPLLATRFALAEVLLQLHLMKGDLPQ